jgi:hypothetical protein
MTTMHAKLIWHRLKFMTLASRCHGDGMVSGRLWRMEVKIVPTLSSIVDICNKCCALCLSHYPGIQVPWWQPVDSGRLERMEDKMELGQQISCWCLNSNDDRC